MDPSPGDEMILRATGERARVIAILDSAGTLILRIGDDEFQTTRDDVEWPWTRHASCACCG